MQTISISEARKRLPELVNLAYLKSKTFLITKGGVPMVKVIKADKVEKKKEYSTKEREKAIKELAGIWKGRWKGMTSVEVADMLRERSQKRYVR